MISGCPSVLDQFVSPSFHSTCTRISKGPRLKTAGFFSIFMSAVKEKARKYAIREKQTTNEKQATFRILLPPFCWLYFLIPVFQKMPSSLSVMAQREGLSSPPKRHPPPSPPPSRQSCLNPLPLFTATLSSPWTARACFPLVLICRWAPPLSSVDLP